MTAHQTGVLRIFGKILISFISVVIGWTAGGMVMLSDALLATHQRHRPFAEMWPLFHPYLLAMGCFILPIWLFLLIPVYVFVPQSSRFWHLSTCVSTGGLMGAAILAVFFLLGGLPPLAFWPFLIEAALIGGITFFSGSLFLRRLASS